LPTAKLTQSLVFSIKPQEKILEVRDVYLKGFGIRITPSGDRTYFLNCQRMGLKIKHNLGSCDDQSLFEARMKVKRLLYPKDINKDLLFNMVNVLFYDFAHQVFENYKRHWKPSTYQVNKSYLHCQIFPYFISKPIVEIDQQDVVNWFSSLHKTPSAANRSLPILSTILKQAELMDIRPEGSNPCIGIKRYKVNKAKKFLTSDGVRKFIKSLENYTTTYFYEVVALKLILFTGCRKNEIFKSEWKWVQNNQLFLPDSKTGPRVIWLSQPAKALLNSLPRTSKYIFPDKNNLHYNRRVDYFWRKFRRETDFSDLRIHDLRHTYASLASASGENILTVSKLLGHNHIKTTMIYTHSPENEAHKAVDLIAKGFDG